MNLSRHGMQRLDFTRMQPDAGSDVKNVSTSAVKSADGKHYIVNGSKKWITNASASFNMYVNSADFRKSGATTSPPPSEPLASPVTPKGLLSS